MYKNKIRLLNLKPSFNKCVFYSLNRGIVSSRNDTPMLCVPPLTKYLDPPSTIYHLQNTTYTIRYPIKQFIPIPKQMLIIPTDNTPRHSLRFVFVSLNAFSGVPTERFNALRSQTVHKYHKYSMTPPGEI